MLRGIACDMRGGTSAGSAGSTGGRQRGRGRSSTAACAQIADHLDENRRKTAVVTEVVCTLGRLSTRTILINAMHQPDPCPQPPARPLGTTNTQFLHNLACNPPTTHSNLETRTLIFRNFRGCLRAYCEELHATCGEAPQRYLRDRQEDANAVAVGYLQQHAPKTQTTSTKTAKKQPLWPRWSALWAIFRRGHTHQRDAPTGSVSAAASSSPRSPRHHKHTAPP